ncbi:MAG: acyltransferase [Caulobacteraceae bacterium]|jgi:exopolysaccharide production protein ExoZ|nr:acyltransferase [Caulobacteraceae bacterium]
MRADVTAGSEADPFLPDPPAEPAPRAALWNIQALRALAALMVVFVHIQALAVMAGLSAGVFEFGNAGVDIFFVISGFIMVFTTARRPMGSIAFLLARLQRIAPLYWSITLAVFAVAILAPQLLQTTRPDSQHLLASLLFLPFQRTDGSTRPVVFVGWTLNYEMAFYVLFAMGLMLRRRAMGVLLAFGALLALVVWGQWARPTSAAGAFYSTPMILEFGLGMLLGLAWPRMTFSRSAAMLLGLAGAGAFLFILAAPALFPNGERFLSFGLPAFLILTAALALEQAGFSLAWPWVRRLGNASYAIYLSHFFVAQAVILAARKLALHGPGPALGLGLLTFAGVAAVGLGLHYGLEQPMDAALRALGRDRAHKARQLAVPANPYSS